MSTIETRAFLDDDNRSKVDKTLAAFKVSIPAMVEHIDATLTDENIDLGAAWYRVAHEYAQSLVDQYSSLYMDMPESIGGPLTVEKVVGVIAAVSPRMSWVRNQEIAERVIKDFQRHAYVRIYRPQDVAKLIGGALSANLAIAVRIMRGEPISDVLTGVKRRSFYNNIISAGAGDDVTVDTWMQRVVMAVSPDQGMDLDDSLRFLSSRKTATNGVGAGYIAIAHAVREVAKARNLSPATVQAAYWIAATGSVHGWHYKGHGKSAKEYDQ